MKKSIICISILFLFATASVRAIVAQRIESIAGCSKISFSNGQVADVDVIEITDTEIKYKPCGKPDGAQVSVPKSEVLYIKNPEGDMVYRSTKTAVMEVEKINKRDMASSILATVGLILSLASLLIGPLGSIGGIIVSVVALNKIKNEPERYEGRKSAIWGIVVGVLTLLLFASLFASALFG